MNASRKRTTLMGSQRVVKQTLEPRRNSVAAPQQTTSPRASGILTISLVLKY